MKLLLLLTALTFSTAQAMDGGEAAAKAPATPFSSLASWFDTLNDATKSAPAPASATDDGRAEANEVASTAMPHFMAGDASGALDALFSGLEGAPITVTGKTVVTPDLEQVKTEAQGQGDVAYVETRTAMKTAPSSQKARSPKRKESSASKLDADEENRLTQAAQHLREAYGVTGELEFNYSADDADYDEPRYDGANWIPHGAQATIQGLVEATQYNGMRVTVLRRRETETYYDDTLLDAGVHTVVRQVTEPTFGVRLEDGTEFDIARSNLKYEADNEPYLTVIKLDGASTPLTPAQLAACTLDAEDPLASLGPIVRGLQRYLASQTGIPIARQRLMLQTEGQEPEELKERRLLADLPKGAEIYMVINTATEGKPFDCPCGHGEIQVQLNAVPSFRGLQKKLCCDLCAKEIPLASEYTTSRLPLTSRYYHDTRMGDFTSTCDLAGVLFECSKCPKVPQESEAISYLPREAPWAACKDCFAACQHEHQIGPLPTQCPDGHELVRIQQGKNAPTYCDGCRKMNKPGDTVYSCRHKLSEDPKDTRLCEFDYCESCFLGRGALA